MLVLWKNVSTKLNFVILSLTRKLYDSVATDLGNEDYDEVFQEP